MKGYVRALFEPVSDSISLSQKVISQITDAIVRGELKPGDKIAPERELARAFGVSRTAIRDAIKILSGRGLLHVRHGVGIFVTEVQAPEMSNPFEFEGANIRDIFEVRHSIETRTAWFAAQRADQGQIDRLKSIVQEARVQTTDLSLLSKRDAQFHVAVAEASKNYVFVKMMWSLLDVLEESRQESLKIPQRALLSLQEHEGIVEAISNRNPDEARSLMEKHLFSVEGAIVKNLEPRPE